MTVCLPSVRAGTVSAAIDSVRRQGHQNWELLVVMQGPDQDLRSVVASAERADHRVHGMWIPDKGVSRARNAGATAASNDTVAFLDDDCEASPEWLTELMSAFQDDPSVGVAAGSLVAPPKRGWRPSKCPSSVPADFTVRPQTEGIESMNGARFVTASCAVRRWAWHRIGPFDEALGAGTDFRGGEDLDFLLRAVGAQVPIRFLPSAVVHHTSGTRYGVRSVIDMSFAYGSGQGAVAAKLTLADTGDGAEWRRAVRGECLTGPLSRLRLDRILPRLPRLAAFERAYRRCLRDYMVDGSGLLVRHPR